MENKINVAELLKDCPKGMELDCTMFDNVTFEGINKQSKFPISIKIGEHYKYLTKDGCYHDTNCISESKCVIFPKGKTTWEGFVPPCKFKDGDIVFSGFSLISIFKGIKEGYNGRLHSYVSVGKGDSFINIDKDCWTLENIRFATEEEKQKLFDAIKANGYKWNAETKTLEKLVFPKFKVGDKIRHKNNHNVCFTITNIEEDSYVCGANLIFEFNNQDNYELVPNKFDIITLKPFDKVLVRDNNSQEWRISFFSHYNNLTVIKYSCINGYVYMQCIPYEGNEHLRGKINDCDEYYKTWG